MRGNSSGARQGSQTLTMSDIPDRPEPGYFTGRRVLLLQGPVGPFFSRLARDLEKAGASVRKINFNGGDWLFYPDADMNFRGDLREWRSVLSERLAAWDIDTVFVYSDCRSIHEILFSLEGHETLEIFTFEEGYFRPDHVTLERGRTNAFSRIPRDPDFYSRLTAEPPETRRVGYSFLHLALWGIIYHLAAGLLRPLLPARTYHRGLGFREIVPQIRSYWRKLRYWWTERHLRTRLLREHAGDFFLVPLQVGLDSQIRCHSRYGPNGIGDFITEVTRSFARYAPPDTLLVFKHHPLDRGYADYAEIIDNLRARYPNLAGRLLYVHDCHLPDLLDAARGVVVINSTVGLSAIIHERPVKVHGGRAFYDMCGLTAQVSLDAFWKRAEEFRPDPELVRRFQAYVIRKTQINGNFYRKCRGSTLRCGLLWNDDEPGALTAPATTRNATLDGS